MGKYPYLVHVVSLDTPEAPALCCAPAIVVRDQNSDGHMVNVQAFGDGQDNVVYMPDVEHSLEGRLHTYHRTDECDQVELKAAPVPSATTVAAASGGAGDVVHGEGAGGEVVHLTASEGVGVNAQAGPPA